MLGSSKSSRSAWGWTTDVSVIRVPGKMHMIMRVKGINVGTLTGRRPLALVLAVATVVATAACSSPSSSTSGGSSSSGGGGGLPATISITDINGFTGPVSFAGLSAQKGTNLAVEQIEAAGLLGKSKISIDYKDSGSSAQQAASFASEAIANPKVAAILGPSASAQSTAISPIVEKSGMPTAYVQSGSDGVVTGKYTYRLTPPAASYFGIAGAYVQQKGVKTASVLYNSGNPTLVELGKTVIPALAKKDGFKIVGSDGVAVTQQDFTTPATQIAGQGVGVAFLMLTGPQYPVAINQLRQAGFKGDLVLMSAAGAGNLAPAGATAAGAVWPTNFTADQTAGKAQEFVVAYKKKYDGKIPNNYAAEAYDRMWFVARGIAEAKSTNRSAVQKGMATVAKNGFTGAQGQLSFDNNDARVPGVMVKWDGSKEVPEKSGA